MSIRASSLSYTKRDLISLDDEIANYIKEYIPRITDTSQVNTGRLLLTAIAAIEDNLNYSLDQIHLETLFKYARQRENILGSAYFHGYGPNAVSASTVDLTFSMLVGVAGVGGQAIAQYQRCQTIGTPAVEFITLNADTIPEGSASKAGVAAIQGVRIVSEVLSAAATGNPLQEYTLSNPKTPHEYVEISVNGVVWTVVDDFSESQNNDLHCMLEFDDSDYTIVKFGDNEFGFAPPAGAVITATYIYTTTYNVSPNQVRKVVGALASTCGVDNPLKSSGGGSSETNDSIKRNAPAFSRSNDRVMNTQDAVDHARMVAGVYDAWAVASGGARIDVYIMPTGGGVASSALVTQTQTYLDSKKMEGMLIYVHALEPASLRITVNAVTFTNKVQKSTVKSKIKSAIVNQLLYTNLIPGRGFTISDTNAFIENIDSGSLIDYCDLVIHSRYPTVTQSNLAAPGIVGRVDFTDTCGYDEYMLTVVSTTTFVVSKNGLSQAVVGTEGTEYITSDSEIRFTLGVAGAGALTVGDNYSFRTSKYKDNMYLGPHEFLQLEYDNDLIVNVFFGNEYSIITQSGI